MSIPFTCTAQRRVVVHLAEGPYKTVIGTLATDGTVYAKIGCENMSTNAWRVRGPSLIDEHVKPPRYEAWQLDEAAVLVREVAACDWKPGTKPRMGFTAMLFWDGRDPEIPKDKRRTLSAKERKEKAASIVAKRRAEIAEKAALNARCKATLPLVLGEIEATFHRG